MSREDRVQGEAGQVVQAALDQLHEVIGGPVTFAAHDSPIGVTKETWDRSVADFRAAVAAVLRWPHWLALNQAEAAREAAERGTS